MMIKKKEIKKILPKRGKCTNKATFGKVLNIAGSKNYTGAAYLSSLSALKVGAGYVTLASSEQVCQTVASMTPDVTFLALKNLDDLAAQLNNYGVISIGCGLSQNDDAGKLVDFIISASKELLKPTVVDADGLNLLSFMDIRELGQNFIITPHPKELSGLLKIDVEEIQSDREKYAMIAAEKYNCTVVLKGYHTVIASNDKIEINPTGGNVLSKAGTGDVLTGMIAGFLAQGTDSADAAKLGVYIHGAAGDLYAKKCGNYSLLASELLNFVPQILTKL